MNFLKILNFFSIVLIGNLTLSQSDSINYNSQDSEKYSLVEREIFDLFEKADTFIAYNQHDSALFCLEQAEDLAQSQKFVELIGEARYRQGNVYYSISDFISTEERMRSALSQFALVADTIAMANSYKRIGSSLRRSNKYSESLDALNQSLRLYISANDSVGIANAKLNIGNVFKYTGKTEKAKESYREAIVIFAKYDETRSVGSCYNNMGNIFKNDEEYDSAFYFMYKTMEIRIATDDKKGLSYIHHNLANLHIRSGDMDSAEYYVQRSYEYKVETKDLLGQATDLEIFSEIAIKKGYWRDAESHLLEAVEIVENIDDLEFLRELLYKLGYCQLMLKDYRSSAITYRRAEVVQDSISVRHSKDIFEGELVEYELLQDSIQKEQILLQQDLQAAQNQNEELSDKVFRRNLIILVIGLLLLLAVSIPLLLRYRSKLQTTRARHRAFVRSSVPKEEKEILLKEVHHRVKNNFQIINSLIRIQSDFMNGDNFKDKLKDIEGRIKSMALIHEKLYKNDSLSTLNVREYLTDLKSYILDSYDTDIKLNFNLNVEEVEYGIDSLIPLGLIMNETISNSIKHGFKGRSEGTINIILTNTEHLTYLTISDDGEGSSEPIPKLKDESLGLELIHDLTEQLDGKLDLQTAGGFTYKFQFPRLK